MKTGTTVFTLLGGVILPLAALSFNLFILSDGGNDAFFHGLTPTPFHMALIAFVPVFNIIAWLCLKRKCAAGSKLLRVLCGFTVGVCTVYAVELLPLAFMGMIFCTLGFWYFGIGLLGLLPCAPVTALASTLICNSRLSAAAKEEGLSHVRGFALGLLAFALVWSILLGDAALAYYGCKKGVSDDPAVSVQGVRLARLSSRTDVVEAYCRRGGYAGWLWSVFLRQVLDTADASVEARELLYYRITGKNPAYLRSSRSRRGFLSWDGLVGGEKVGGVVEGLSLKDSAYDTTVDRVAGTGYCEWTMTFANSKRWGNAEARCRIVLPPGGVVSRLTLWVNGEESEAAFGTRGQVRRAYESVVRRNRDPVLVNVCGPDQVQLQCFPVPAGGEMKVRLGVTLPLQVALDGKSARFPAPALATRNFSVPSNLIGLPAVETVSLENPPAAVAVAKFLGDSAQPTTEAIVQTSSVGKPWRPSRVAFVIDTSLAMAGSMEATLAALAQTPANLTKEFYFTRDESPAKPETTLPQAVTCCGGRPSLGTLMQAIDSLAAAGGPAALVWIHAGEPVVQQAGDALALKLRKNPQLRLYLCQVALGECPLVESMSPSTGVVSLSADALLGGVGPALKRLFADWGAESWMSERRKVPVAEVPAAAAPASDHLGRLWAAEETARVFRTGDPVALEKAQKTALPWHIVTAATGAVVLETKEQFAATGLEQVPSSSVPTTPEPAAMLSLGVVVFVFVAVFFIRRRRCAA